MTSTLTEIPAEDLKRQYQQIHAEIDAAIKQVLPTGKYTLGPVLEAFEREFAEYCGVKHCIGISNGTEALHLALAAMGVGPGDEVITQANTYVATAFAINYVGAKPVFVDIEPAYANMDASKLEEKITPRTKAIIPVHIYGHPVDMDPIMKLAGRYGLKVLEDASHAHGARYKGKTTGALGHAAAFSFYPSKVLGAYGDAGCIVTDDDDLNHKLRILRYMGQEEKHTHLVIGFQQRLDPLQAAVLSVRLKHLDGWIERRREIAGRYNQLLADLPLELPNQADWAEHVYYMYTIRTAQRDALSEYLQGCGIGTQKIYATPVPMQPCYRYLEYQEADIPISSKYARQLLCLPMFPELRDDEIERVSQAIHQFFEEQGG
ncbi:MAG: DegT/DnrJ/EryC1/StrS family aminotransferase [Anaerolineales bacterium]